MNTSPLDNIEHAYLRHAYGPDPVTFWGGYTTGLAAAPFTLPELTALLTGKKTPTSVKDQVWNSLVKQARVSNEWGLIAAGVAIRALRRAVKRARYHAPNINIQDDLESAAISAFLESIHTIDTSAPQICARLCQSAYVAARQWALDLKQYQETMCSNIFESHPPPDQAKHVDLVLASAVKEGIITRLQADLVTETRLERHSLRESSDHLQIPYPIARREREAAEYELCEWLTGRAPHSRHGSRS